MQTFLTHIVISSAILTITGCAVEDNLHRYAFWGDLKAVESEVANGANVNEIDDNGWTPLYSATSEGHKDVVTYLLSKGAKIDVEDNSGWSILDEGVFKNQTEIVKLLESEQTRRSNRYTSAIQHFGSLILSDRGPRVYSQWFDKYPLPLRSYWNDPFRTVNDYVRKTQVKYLSSEDFHGTRFGFEPDDVNVTQGKFESDRSYQIRVEQIAFEQEQRLKQINQARRLMIADSLQWVMGSFELKNPNYDRTRGVIEFDLVSTTAGFTQRIGTQLEDAKLAKSIYLNPSKVQLDVIFRIENKSYQLYGVKIHHQGRALNTVPLESAVYNLST